MAIELDTLDVLVLKCTFSLMVERMVYMRDMIGSGEYNLQEWQDTFDTHFKLCDIVSENCRPLFTLVNCPKPEGFENFYEHFAFQNMLHDMKTPIEKIELIDHIVDSLSKSKLCD